MDTPVSKSRKQDLLWNGAHAPDCSQSNFRYLPASAPHAASAAGGRAIPFSFVNKRSCATRRGLGGDARYSARPARRLAWSLGLDEVLATRQGISAVGLNGKGL
jgi:hypothetical protein